MVVGMVSLRELEAIVIVEEDDHEATARTVGDMCLDHDTYNNYPLLLCYSECGIESIITKKISQFARVEQGSAGQSQLLHDHPAQLYGKA